MTTAFTVKRTGGGTRYIFSMWEDGTKIVGAPSRDYSADCIYQAFSGYGWFPVGQYWSTQPLNSECVCICQQDPSMVVVYIDGNAGPGNHDTTGGVTAFNTLYIGGKIGAEDCFVGYVKKFRVWNRKLTDTEKATISAGY